MDFGTKLKYFSYSMCTVEQDERVWVLLWYGYLKARFSGGNRDGRTK